MDQEGEWHQMHKRVYVLTFGRCRCAVMNMPINVIIRNRDGKVIKTFDLRGIPSVDQITLWIWRDLFVSLSATGGRFLTNAMPDMLEEIESVMGWPALDLLLYGGKKGEIIDLYSLCC